jgi:hypothetical protein
VVKYLKGRNTLISDLKGELNLESDYEGDSTGVGLGTSKMKVEDEEETRAVLITGSFSACVHFLVSYWRWDDESRSWKSLFFYRCTDAVSFAPLKSQGTDSRLEYIREKTAEEAPPPCSPKSIYVLASLVSQRLTNRSMHNVDKSISASN